VLFIIFILHINFNFFCFYEKDYGFIKKKKKTLRLHYNTRKMRSYKVRKLEVIKLIFSSSTIKEI